MFPEPISSESTSHIVTSSPFSLNTWTRADSSIILLSFDGTRPGSIKDPRCIFLSQMLLNSSLSVSLTTIQCCAASAHSVKAPSSYQVELHQCLIFSCLNFFYTYISLLSYKNFFIFKMETSITEMLEGALQAEGYSDKVVIWNA